MISFAMHALAAVAVDVIFEFATAFLDVFGPNLLK
jgi:hypothetical protein